MLMIVKGLMIKVREEVAVDGAKSCMLLDNYFICCLVIFAHKV